MSIDLKSFSSSLWTIKSLTAEYDPERFTVNFSSSAFCQEAKELIHRISETKQAKTLKAHLLVNQLKHDLSKLLEPLFTRMQDRWAG